MLLSTLVASTLVVAGFELEDRCAFEARTTPACQPSGAPCVRQGTEDLGRLVWFEGDFEELRAEALRSNRLVFLHFWTGWCGKCKRLHRTTYADDAVVREMSDVLCFAVDASKDAGRRLARRFAVKSFPALIVLDPDGSPRDRIGGFLGAEELVREMRRVRADRVGTVAALRRAVEERPGDLAARHVLAKKLRSLGNEPGYRGEIEAIERADPDGRSLTSRCIGLERLLDAMDATYRESERDVDALDTSDLRAFLGQERHASILFEGWDVVAQVEVHRARQLEELERQAEAVEARRDSRRAYASAWPHCPEERLVDFGNRLAWSHYEAAGELSPAELRFALEVARRASRAAPRDAHVLDTLACCHFVAGDVPEAIAVIRRCIELDPTNVTWKRRLETFEGDAQRRRPR